MKKSAGILPFRMINYRIEVFLVHPGGPFWKNKDNAAWSIAKGEFKENEDPLTAACREFKEETGVNCDGPFIELASIKQRSGKMVYAWAAKMDFDASLVTSNKILIEWPPKSGKMLEIPEIDKAAWFPPVTAKQKIIPAQAILIDDLLDKLNLLE